MSTKVIVGDAVYGSVADALEGMKFMMGVEADRELAARLRTAPHNVAAWKRRGSIPDKYLMRFRRMIDETASEARYRPLRWQPHEAAEVSLPMLVEAYVYALIGVSAARLLEDVRHSGNDEYLEVGVGFRLMKIERFIRARIEAANISDKDEGRATFESIAAELKAADIWMFTEAL